MEEKLEILGSQLPAEETGLLCCHLRGHRLLEPRSTGQGRFTNLTEISYENIDLATTSVKFVKTLVFDLSCLARFPHSIDGRQLNTQREE